MEQIPKEGRIEECTCIACGYIQRLFVPKTFKLDMIQCFSCKKMLSKRPSPIDMLGDTDEEHGLV